ISDTPTGRALDSSAVAGSGYAEVYLIKNTSASMTKQVSIRSKVRVVQLDSGFNVNALAFNGLDNTYSLVFPVVNALRQLRIGEVSCPASGCDYRQSDPVPFAIDDWHDLSLMVDFSTTPTHFVVTIDGTPFDTPSQFDVQPGALEIRGGGTASPD